MKKIILTLLCCFIATQSFANRFSLDDADLALSIKLLKEDFKKEEKKENTVVSPFSIYMATAMLANGAENKSLLELMTVLSEDENIDINAINKNLNQYVKKLSDKVEVNNSVWGDFSPEYVDVVNTQLMASAMPLPQSTSTINEWIEEKTKGMIKDALEIENIDPYTLYLINTIYFKDKWLSPFDKEDTKKSRAFYSLDGSVSSVDMMNKEMQVQYFENSEIQSIKLPYKDGDFMHIFLPKEGVDFSKFIKELGVKDLNVEYEAKMVKIYLPKFEITTELILNETLKRFGVLRVFDISLSELGKLTPFNAYLKNATHQAKIILDEDGTEAAASTQYESTLKGGGFERKPKIRYFIADRPFVFMINKGMFIGTFVKGDNTAPQNLGNLESTFFEKIDYLIPSYGRNIISIITLIIFGGILYLLCKLLKKLILFIIRLFKK